MAESTHNLSLEEMDRQSVLHPFTPLKAYAAGETGGPRIVEGGEGIRIRDSKGNELIDGFAGLYCVNVGYGRDEIADAIHAQAKQLAYYHAYAGHSNEPAIRLSDKILRQAPDTMSKIFYGLGGSDANETNVKIVWYYNAVRGMPQKTKIIARKRGYHGGLVFSGSLTGLQVFHTAFNLPVQLALHTTVPHPYWHAEPGMSERAFSKKCAADLDALIEAEGPETVGAFIGEPVLGTGGIIPPPEGYWEEIQPVLDRHDVLLISDEVVCGFGRLGSAFGALHYGMKPDLMTVAKGLTSAYQPLSGSIVGDKVWKVLEEGSEQYGPWAHGLTYSAHPCGAAAALANLEIIEREDLTGNAKRTGAYLQKRMHEAFDGHPIVGEVRGEGLLAAIEFVADPAAKTPFDPSMKVGAQLAAACVERGLISRAMPHGDILGFAPPLTITEAEVDEVVERTQQAVAAVTDKLTREGHLKAA